MREDDLEPEDRDLIAKLKELPPEGEEPDWQALEAAIRAEVGDDAPRPWWRNWRWIVPVWALATTAAVALLVVRNHAPEQQAVLVPGDAARLVAPVPVEPVAAEPAHAAAPTALWLDGEMVEVDEVPGSALDDIDGDARAALAPDTDVSGGILPVTDYGWID